ncbi:MAG: hypothetical protein A3C04_00190 [Candidatus Wildermuthbacteria bacterium RIFCSPHIGHO2_02_FULL_45_25]|uniref:Uncharacterized protein n=1 Tax=Candidatus Wildermuthbacteria bacterium RIFCSPHIGHO2_02_FULL_45_25 TaxID=1802450 RepID=A0A1G2QZF5_9BACT|nr:MAG: hypothetical protein A3C04_00190 [Candidatus Wildermuthbacteria bacterium RIFCSPHIGHO2_02_FULL_45_25]
MPPRPAFGGATPQQNFLLQFSDFARSPQENQIRKKKILFWRSALYRAGGGGLTLVGKKFPSH